MRNIQERKMSRVGGATRHEALRLYRAWMVQIKAFPHEHLRRKVRMNVSDAFKIYKDESDATRIAQQLEQGRHDLQVFTRFSALDAATQDMLFNGFLLTSDDKD
ncbi:hypothetical protein QOT17_021969 [Balamuthia mandrillaris]